MTDHDEGAAPADGRAPAGVRTGSRATTRSDDRHPALSDHARTRLGGHLRAMYDSVVQQPVPDRFRDLIARLDAGETGGGTGRDA